MVLGARAQDGNTQVNVFELTSKSNQYLVAGHSDSNGFTANFKNECEDGCAFVAVWNQSTDKYLKSWILPDTDEVVAISVDGDLAAILFSRFSDGLYKYSLRFIEWTATEKMEFWDLEYLIT